jgi:hypothetical protein
MDAANAVAGGGFYGTYETDGTNAGRTVLMPSSVVLAASPHPDLLPSDGRRDSDWMMTVICEWVLG